VNRIARPARKAISNFSAHSVDLNRLHVATKPALAFTVNNETSEIFFSHDNGDGGAALFG
jgi:hypothetical protein